MNDRPTPDRWPEPLPPGVLPAGVRPPQDPARGPLLPADHPLLGAPDAPDSDPGRDPGSLALPDLLIVAPEAQTLERLGRAFDAFAVHLTSVRSADAARRHAGSTRFDAALVHADTPEAARLVSDLTQRDRPVACVLVSERPTLEQAVDAMRRGCADIVSSSDAPAEITARVRGAIQRARPLRERERQVERLRHVCKSLDGARSDMGRQVSGLCTDLTRACRELSDQLGLVTFVSEFNSIVRQELDIESLLRVVLEFVLAKAGPTNAAVYLPGTSRDFSLGAYVNYDCPKDAGDMLLDHLGDVLAPLFESEERALTVSTSEEDLVELLGQDAGWLTGYEVVTFGCHHDGECLAVVTLFRDRRTPFTRPIVEHLRTMAGLFARQLARVIHVHHRHLPKDKWGGLGEDADDLGLTA